MIEEVLTQEEQIKSNVKGLIKELGGPKKVANTVFEKSGIRLTKTHICGWYNKNIPLKYLVILLYHTRQYKGYDFYDDLFYRIKKG